MTENKRFRKVLGFIQDTTCEGGDVNGVMDSTEIEDMLNEQHETIERLKKNFQALDKVKCEIAEENEQLYELINFANTLIAFKTSESCQKEWEKKLKELQE